MSRKLLGLLTKYRQVPCPTCKVGAGNFCKSIGARGRVAGHIMTTSCHNSRMVAAGFPPRNTHPPATTDSTEHERRSAGGHKAWATRRAHQKGKLKPEPKLSASAKKRSEAMKASWARRAGLKRLKAAKLLGNSINYSSTNKPAVGLGKLLEAAVDILRSGAVNVTLSFESVGQVYGEHRGSKIWLKVTE